MRQPRGFGLLAAGPQHGQAGTHCTFGIVFARFVHAERRLDAVAGELQHAAVMGFD